MNQSIPPAWRFFPKQIVKMSFTGEALSYFMSSIYTITVSSLLSVW